MDLIIANSFVFSCIEIVDNEKIKTPVKIIVEIPIKFKKIRIPVESALSNAVAIGIEIEYSNDIILEKVKKIYLNLII